MQKPFSLPFQASRLAFKINQNIICFRAPFWDIIFLILCLFEKRSLWGPLQNPVGAKMRFKSTKWRQNGAPFLGPDLLLHFGRPSAHF